MAGDDVMVVERGECFATVHDIDGHTVQDLPICTVAALVHSNKGPIIVIMHQYAYLGKGKTIHLSAQIEYDKNSVNDKSSKVGGKQHIVTLYGYIIPLNICNGLAYMEMSVTMDKEFSTFPHAVLNSNVNWDPTILVSEFDPEVKWQDAQEDDFFDPNFDDTANYLHCQIAFLDTFCSVEEQEDFDNKVDRLLLHVNHNKVKMKEPDYEALHPCFAWAPADIVKKTLEATMQYAQNSYNLPFCKHYCSCFPALNVDCCCEAVATNTIYSDTPAINDGATCAQIFVGQETLVANVYGMKLDNQLIYTLEDNVCKRGAMDKLISDSAQVEISNKVKAFL